MTTTIASRRPAHTLRLLAGAAPGIIGRGVQFLALAWLATLVRPEQYGTFAVLQSLVIGVASVVGSTVGVTANVATASARGVTGAGAMAVAVLRLRTRLLVTNAITSVLVVVVGFVVLTRPASLGQILPAFVAGVLGGAVPIAEVLVGVLAGSGRTGLAAGVDAVRGIGGASGAVLLGVLVDGAAAASGLLVVDVVIAAALLTHSLRIGEQNLGLDTATSGGASAGVAANVLGQMASWMVVGAVSVTGGPVAMGVYGVATRFASVVTVAPVYLGRVAVRHFVDAPDTRPTWTPRSFVAVVGGLSVIGSALSLLILLVVFPELVALYPGVVPVTIAVLVATSVRALLICVGQVCVARRAWRTWVVADLAAACATAGALSVVLALGGSLSIVVLAAGAGHAAGLLVRLIGLRRGRRVLSAGVA
jgi:hypothetical protein